MVRLSLIPRDPRYFDYFEQAGANLLELVRELDALLSDYTDVAPKLARLRELEHTGDTVTHQVMRELNQSFITPLDREDITALIHALDDVADKAWAAASRLDVYQIGEPTETSRSIARVLVQMVEALVQALPHLRHRGDMQRIIPITEQLDQLDTEADDHLRAGLRVLFTNPTTVDDLARDIKWREIYEFLEDATDKAEDAANVLEAIVLKHG